MQDLRKAVVPPRVCSFFRGGLGDVLERYVEYGRDPGRWAAIKAAHPGIAIDVACVNVNPAIGDLFSTHPLIDRVSVRPYCDPVRPTLFAMAREMESVPIRYGLDLANYRWALPEIPLGPVERSVAASILAAGPYVAIHPFAGDTCRSMMAMMGRDWVRNLTDWVADHNNGRYRVVLLGGSSVRDHQGRKANIDERFDYDRNGLFNLIGRHSIRLHAYLAMNATKSIGTMSCYSTMAQAAGIPTLIFTSEHLLPAIHFDKFSTFRIARERRTKFLFWAYMFNVDVKRCVTTFLDGRDGWRVCPIDSLDDL